MEFEAVVQEVEEAAKRQGGATAKLAVHRTGAVSRQEIEARGGVEVARAGVFITPPHEGARTTTVTSERLSANILKAIAAEAPGLLEVAAFLPTRWVDLLRVADPLNGFDPETQDAVLSPVGVLQLYRQFFFELDSFLGPAVGHVWMSPGTTLELIETHSRKSLHEKKVEMNILSISKRDLKTEESDELSTRVSDQNTSSTSLGVSANAGVNFGVFHADASANVSLSSSHSTSQEIAHQSTRQQSEQLSTELRREFKTTIRTVLESEDTSARNYKIQNTSDKLLNYEMRRKMRRVAVQLQSIGAQLCWQVYVDEPGAGMGIAELVHVAQPDDASVDVQPPEAPQPLPAQETDFTFDFPFEVVSDYPCPDNVSIEGDDGHGTIVWKKTVRATPPGPGYTLAFVNQSDVQGTEPDAEGPWLVVASFKVVTGATDTFEIRLDQVVFGEQPTIRFFLALSWSPPSQEEALKTFQEQWADYEQRKAKAAHDEFVKAVRDRVKAAAEVLPRSSDDMRAEERSAIFSRLLSMRKASSYCAMRVAVSG